MGLPDSIRALVVSALVLPPLLSFLPPLQAVQAGPLRAEPALLIAQASPGSSPEVPAQVLRWRQQIQELYKQGRYAEAIPLQMQELAWVERVLGKEHPDTASSLNDLAELYKSQGHYGEAEPLYKRALAIHEKVLGKEHPATAISLNNLGELYESQGRYGEAESLYRRTIAIVEKVLGKEHPNTATILDELAAFYSQQDRYGEAEPLYKRALAIREKVRGKEHPDTATSLSNLSALYYNQGRYGEAEPLCKRALAIREKALGLEHPDTATSLNNLADVYSQQDRYGEAEPLHKRALAIREKGLGKEHPLTASSLNNLADVYSEQGRYGEAESLLKRALAIREKVLGKEHPDTATSLNNLSSLYESQGRYGEAEPLHKRALAIREKVLGKEHPDTAISLINLATLYQRQDRYGDAEPLLKRALAILEKALGKEHPDTASSLNNLASLYSSKGRYGEAESLYKRALAIREKVLGKEHPDTAISLNNLAELYQRRGRYGEAEPLYKRTIAIVEKVLGKEHPSTAIMLINLANLNQSQGRYGDAEPLLLRGIDIQSRFLQEQLPLLPQSARQAQIQALEADAWEVAFTAADRSQSAAELALFSRLNRYGLLLEIEQRQALLSRAPGPTRQLAQEITALTSQLADVRLSPAQHQALAARRDGLEQELYRQLPALKPLIVEPAQLAKALPVGAALLEFQRYRPFDGRQPKQRWGPPRYLALVLTREGTPRAVDLGPAGPLDALIAQALATTQEEEEKRQPGAPPMALWQEVSARMFPPALLQLLANNKQWILAPDGELSRIPFTALPSPQDPKRLLPDAVALRLITSGRTLVRPTTASSGPPSRPLVLANPDYGPAPSGTTPWYALAATEKEGRWISTLLNSIYYEQAAATTSKLIAAQGPRLLHVASHGYYAGASPQPAPRAPVRLGFAEGLTRSAFAGLPAAREDAMLNSAIVLAGANRHLRPGSLPAGPASSAGSADADDGYLTAKEAAQLQLAGTELVVLSACDTLAGAQQSGEGLYGLQRALNAAGARTTLLSLWKVDDAATAAFMQRYYGLLKQGNGRMEALLAVQQHFRTNPPLAKWSDPRYWAAWQLVGETGPIQGL